MQNVFRSHPMPLLQSSHLKRPQDVRRTYFSDSALLLHPASGRPCPSPGLNRSVEIATYGSAEPTDDGGDDAPRADDAARVGDEEPGAEIQQLAVDELLKDVSENLRREYSRGAERDGQVLFEDFERRCDGFVAVDHVHFVGEDGARAAESRSDEEEPPPSVAELQMAARCTGNTCEYLPCLKGKRHLHGIVEKLEEPGRDWKRTKLSTAERLTLTSLFEHSIDCDDVSCTVPWCFFFYQCVHNGNRWCFGPLLAALRRFYVSSGYGESYKFTVNEESTTFLQFDDSIQWPTIVYEYGVVPQHQDFKVTNVSCPKFGRIQMRATTITIPPEIVNITQYATCDQTLDVDKWSRLRQLGTWSGGVHHLWVSVGPKIVNVCTLYNHTAKSLLQKLDTGPLAETDRWRYITDIIGAVEQLHQLDILYLGWTAAAIQLIDADRTARLCDFSLAVSESSIGRDGEPVDEAVSMIQMSLPATITPPEMYDYDVGKHSDVWGLGCLLYEMMTRTPMHDDRRHETEDDVRDWIRDWDPLTSPVVQKCSVLRQTLIDKATRVDLTTLRRLCSAELASSLSGPGLNG